MLEDATRREQHDLELLRRIHEDDDLMAREELAQRCMPLVKSIARKYRNNSEQFEDLVQAGSIGLVKAIDRFDRGAGHRFVSFAVPNIQGEIRRHFRDHCWAVHVPRGTQELSHRVKQHQQHAWTTLGRESTVDELAEVLEVPEQQVIEALTAGEAYDARSLDHPLGEDRTVLDAHGTDDSGYAAVEDRMIVEDAFRSLDERSRRVVRERFYGERLQREIAGDIGVSQMQVSRIITRALGDMREQLAAADGALAA